MRSNRGWQAWVAVAAAYLVVLQLVFGSLAQVHAAAADLPLVLCTNSSPDESGNGPAPHHVPDCCLHGCCALATLLALPSDAAALPFPHPAMAVAALGRPGIVGARRPEDAPRRTRGPPA